MDPALAAIIAMQRQQQEAQAEMLRQRNLQAQAIQEQAAAAAAHARTKKQREVYVGNLTPGLTSVEMLKQVRLKTATRDDEKNPTQTKVILRRQPSQPHRTGLVLLHWRSNAPTSLILTHPTESRRFRLRR